MPEQHPLRTQTSLPDMSNARSPNSVPPGTPGWLSHFLQAMRCRAGLLPMPFLRLLLPGRPFSDTDTAEEDGPALASWCWYRMCTTPTTGRGRLRRKSTDADADAGAADGEGASIMMWCVLGTMGAQRLSTVCVMLFCQSVSASLRWYMPLPMHVACPEFAMVSMVCIYTSYTSLAPATSVVAQTPAARGGERGGACVVLAGYP